MTESEYYLRKLLEPVKLKYHASTTEEYAERAYNHVFYLATHCVELADRVNRLEASMLKLLLEIKKIKEIK